MSGQAKKLEARHDALTFAAEILIVTNQFPQHELFCLSNQLRQGAMSIPDDIYRWDNNYSDRTFEDRLMHARHTLLEVQTQLMIANELQYISAEETQRLCVSAEELRRRIGTLVKSLHNNVA
jgi:four helix bundle protein